MRLPILSTSILSLAVLGAVAQAADIPATARYKVTFERTWSSQTHPADFPLLAHFSPVIGATHGGGFELFQNGSTATPGIEKLCEEGKHQPLDSEIQRAIQRGMAGALIETSEPIRDVPGKAEAEFTIDSTHPMVSIAAMIAPSPDWCAVANDVSLMDANGFVAEKTVSLEAWDVGTDSATSYRALDADMQPRGPVQKNQSSYFEARGNHNVVGRVTFTRLP